MSVKKRDNKKRILREGESQRSDGRYMYRYRDSRGERKTIYSWRLTETDEHPAGKKKDLSLREKEEAIAKDLLDGINISGASITLNELFERYIGTKKRLKNNVKDTYKSMYNKHIRETYVGTLPIKAITKNDVLNIYETMADAGLSNGTIQNIHNNILFPTLQLAVDNDWLRKNPTKDCLKEYPYDAMEKREALSIKQQNIFIDFLRKDNVYSKYLPIVLLILETALRRGEVLGLTWNDIDLKNKIVRVDHQLHYYSVNGKYSLEVGTPKTKSGKRDVPLSENAVSCLQYIKKKEYFSSIGSGVRIGRYTGFIFLNQKKNNVIIPRQFSDALTAACKKYNKKELEAAEKEKREPELLPMITPHILRHTACTRLSERGVNIKVLQAVMGHKRANTTLNVYDHADLHRITKEFQNVNVVEGACLLG